MSSLTVNNEFECTKAQKRPVLRMWRKGKACMANDVHLIEVNWKGRDRPVQLWSWKWSGAIARFYQNFSNIFASWRNALLKFGRSLPKHFEFSNKFNNFIKLVVIRIFTILAPVFKNPNLLKCQDSPFIVFITALCTNICLRKSASAWRCN